MEDLLAEGDYGEDLYGEEQEEEEEQGAVEPAGEGGNKGNSSAEVCMGLTRYKRWTSFVCHA